MTRGPNRLLSVVVPRPVQFMRWHYLQTVYTWPRRLAKTCIFGPHKHEGCFSRRSLFGTSGDLHRTPALRFPNATTEFVTQIAFSPTRNLLAWTDFAGSLYRWSDPIPSTSPSPVASAPTSALTRPVRRGPTPTLFDDDQVAPKSHQKDDVAIGGADDFENEDWILDDIGGGLEEDDIGAQADDGNAFVKEMGRSIPMFRDVS